MRLFRIVFGFNLIVFSAVPLLFASGDWFGSPAVPADDLSTYTAETGVITGLNLKNKLPLIQFTTEAGEVLVLVIPKTAFLSINGKLVGVNRLQVGRRAAMRWTVRNDLRVVGMLDVLPEEPINTKPMKRPPLPTMPQPNLTRPIAAPLQPQLSQPTATPLLREPAPAPRPAVPSMPSLNQEIRR